MNTKENNYAFIDSQNLNLGVRSLGWRVDFKKLRIYLAEKYKVNRAYLFLGYLSENQDLYLTLKRAGFHLIFKPVVIGIEGRVKGNCDAELVLQAMIDFKNYNKAVIVSGDGDFYCLVDYLYFKNKLRVVLAPNRNKYSGLLKQAAREKLEFFNKLQPILAYEKAPHKDETM